MSLLPNNGTAVIDLPLMMTRLLLAATFAVAAIAKLANPALARKSMLDFGAPALLAKPLAWILPCAELASAIALIPLASAWWGAAGALALTLLFLAVILVSLAHGHRPDCHCFGQLPAAPV